MALTNNQRNTLKAAILAAGGEITAAFNAGASSQVADLCNVATVNKAWSEAADCGDILEAVDFTAYTPTVKPQAADTQVISMLNMVRAGYVAIKQMNLQTLLGRPGSIDCTKPDIRKAVADSVTDILAGSAGAAITAGASGVTLPTSTDWSTVAAACQRTMTFAENALRGASVSTQGSAAFRMNWIGFINTQDIDAMYG